MGVVTDYTVQQLKNAVGDIDTSGLMKDTTGQAIVTAINNIGSSISPSASNVSYNNTSSGLSASNVQSAIDELDSFADSLDLRTSSITRYSGVSSSVPLPAISRRGKIVIVHFAHQLPAGTYTDIWNISPAPASQQHAIVSFAGGWTLVAVTTAGILRFNNSITINSPSYIVGQIVYNCN